MIIDRLIKYMEANGLNDNQVTRDCKLSVGLINKARRGKSDLGRNSIEKILNTYKDINRAWLLTGEGEMLKGTPSTDADILSLAGKNEFLMAYLQEKDRKIEELLRENARLQIELSQAQQMPKEPLVMPAGHSVTPPLPHIFFKTNEIEFYITESKNNPVA